MARTIVMNTMEHEEAIFIPFKNYNSQDVKHTDAVLYYQSSTLKERVPSMNVYADGVEIGIVIDVNSLT